jgi:hypothetical protein
LPRFRRTHVDAAAATLSLKDFHDTERAFSFRLQRSGALGEYNGKLMISKWYFGSSLAAPSGHPRQTYHDFFFCW